MESKFEVRFKTDYWEDPYEHVHLMLYDIEPQSLSLQCPHCAVYSSLRIEKTVKRFDWEDDGVVVQPLQSGSFDFICSCPHCRNTIFVQAAAHIFVTNRTEIEKTSGGTIVSYYPYKKHVQVAPKIPNKYANDFREAQLVLDVSPKASAALSRRIVQNVIREEFGIRHNSLASEIVKFIALPDIPSYLADAVDAIRNVGNFAAHPIKDTSTGEIAEVEPGEAEWLIEVLDDLLDFTFVQPKRLDERKQQLNEKLARLGKPPMKSSTKGNLAAG